MSQSFTSPPGARRGYHHGALKQALLDVAEELIAEAGAAGFTLTDAARRAGVSPAAPYRHFADREALLAAVARRGFADFGASLREAAGAQGTPGAGFAAMGRAYLAFARARPGAYAAMFSLPRSGEGPAPAAAEAAFAALTGALAAALPDDGLGEAGRLVLARQIWALAHGLATLAAAGRGGDDDAALLQQGTLALIGGALRRKAGPGCRR